jgi:hypothetical protein
VDQVSGRHPALVQEQAVDARVGEDPREVGDVDRGGLRLAKVFRKLQMKSRTELARMMREAGRLDDADLPLPR